MSEAVGRSSMTPFLAAGVCAGVAGLLTFLVIHHFWILPIWFIAPAGLVFAGLGGLAVGWSYAELSTALPSRPRTFLAVTGIIAVILGPSILLAQFRPPLFDKGTSSFPPEGVARVVVYIVTELLITAVLMGAVVGWLVGHTRHATIATALVGFVYALGPGHNIPVLGNTPAAGKGVILLLAITLVSAFVLMEASARLLKR